MFTRGVSAVLVRCLKVSALAVVLTIARWLWSRRKKNGVEDDKSKTPVAVEGPGVTGGAVPLLHAGVAVANSAPSPEEDCNPGARPIINYKYDCFLSHKRIDCHDICLRISDNLKFKGVLPFIDRECLGGMDSLTEQVRCSRVFFFFLTNNVFRSPWCILELVEADKAGAILVPVLVEGAGWGPHGVRKFPDVELDCCEEYEPMPGMKIRPRAALRRMFSSVAIDLSRTYFDPFVDKLAARVESAGGGNSAAGQLRRMDNKTLSPDKTIQEIKTAEDFWQSSLGGLEQCTWIAFEGALRTFLADDPTTVEAVLGPLEGAICDHSGASRISGGTVNFSALAATFAGGNFNDTLRAMASESSAADIVFDIVVRVPVTSTQGKSSNKDYLVDDERSTSFVMVKSSDTLARVRQTIIDAFKDDDIIADASTDSESDSGLEFLGEGNFSFVFQVGAGKSGKTSGAVHWTRARRQQERRVTAVGLTNLSIVEDGKGVGVNRRWDQSKPKEKAPAEGSFQSRYTASGSGSERSDEDDASSQMSLEDNVHLVDNPDEFALANGVLHQAKVRAAEALTTSDILAELRDNPNAVIAPVNHGQSAKSSTDSAHFADFASPRGDFKSNLMRAHRGKSAPSDGVGGKRERVVVLGGGFAGCTAAAKLDRHPNLHVTLVDTKEYFENSPAVLRCISEENHEMFDLCHIEHKEYILNGSVVIGRATSIDEEQGVVYVGLKGSMGSQVLPFDYLVVATGASNRANIKTTHPSLSSRKKQFKQERKRIAESAKVIVVGGGAVGTEMAGEVMSFFPDVPVEVIARNSCLVPRSHGAHELAVSILQDPKLERPVEISYGETLDFSFVDHATNTVTTSKGRDLDLNGTRVLNCTGYTPNSDFLPRKWLNSKRFIVCTPQMEIEAKAVPKELRTAPSSRFYFAMGDICEESKFPDGERTAAVAQIHAYGITYSIMRLAEARAATRRAGSRAANRRAEADQASSGSSSTSSAKPEGPDIPHPKLFKMDVTSSTGLYMGIPWNNISLGVDYGISRLDNPDYEDYAAAYFFNPAQIKEEQGPITNGWIGLGPAATKFSIMGIVPAILRPEPDNMPLWDEFNSGRMSEEDDKA